MKLFTQFALLCCLGLPLSAHAQSEFHLQQQTLANPDNEPAPVHPVPSPRQLKWQETEFYAFFHYGMNTYTGLEWGNGDENENRFAPTRVPNPEQWLQAAKDAGMRGGIAVIKHHDGFCLWPTATTTPNAITSGMMDAVCGAVIMMHGRLQQKTGEGKPVDVIITGGGASKVVNALPKQFVLDNTVKIVDNLVIYGLLNWVAQEQE